MRNLKRQEQDIYVCRVIVKEELQDKDGNYTGEHVDKISNPVKYKKFCLNPTIGNSTFSPYGATQDERREMTTHDMSADIRTGDLLYVDIEPELNKDGSLVMSDDGRNPSVMYDYTVTGPMKSKKGNLARYTIRRRS